MRRLAFDVEANALLNEATEIHCVVTKDLDTGEITKYTSRGTAAGPEYPISYAIDHLTVADEVWAHNAIKFDVPVLDKLWGFSTNRVRDSLVCLRLMFPDTYAIDAGLVKSKKLPQNLMGSHSLEAWGHRIGEHKQDYRGGFEVFTQEMLDYCVQDVEVLAKLVSNIEKKKYSQQAIEMEHKFAEMIFAQEQNGFGFDLKKARALHVDLMARHDGLLAELDKAFPPRREVMKTRYWVVKSKRFDTKAEAVRAGLSGGDWGDFKEKLIPFNPSSRAECADRLRQKYGWKPKQVKDSKTGKVSTKLSDDVFADLDYPEAHLISEMLMIRKRLGQLSDGKAAWLKLEKSGRIHGSVNTNGAVTGRCTHSNPNMAQVPKVSDRVPFGERCRDLFGPTRPGWKLVGCDASSLELRCLAHYMAAWDRGEYGRAVIDGDMHTLNQKAAGLETRDQAKTFIYAFIYGAGDGKLGAIAGGGAKKGAELRENFLTQVPALGALIQAVQAKAVSVGFLRGMDGRILNVRSKHSALNTLLQSAGAVAMKQALIEFDAELHKRGLRRGEDFAFCANIHDEFQTECKPEHVPVLLEVGPLAIQRAGEVLGFQVPLTGEAKVGDTWAETH